jgi:hypothetical protein
MLNEAIAEALDAPYKQARQEGAEEERKKIADWLRETSKHSKIASTLLRLMADEIESGDYGKG